MQKDWQELPKLKILSPRITKPNRLVVGISYKDAGYDYSEVVKTAIKSDEYRDFLTEHCLRFESYGGTPVVQNFNRDIHTIGYSGINKKLPLVIGFDFGGTNPAYVTAQMEAGKLLLHEADKPVKKEGYEIDIRSICQRLKARFNDPYDDLYNDQPWKLTVIGDHAGTFENNQGVPGTAAKIVSEELKSTMLSHQMTSQVYQQSFKLLTDIFSKNNQIAINPDSQILMKLFLGGWRYPENVHKQQHPKPDADGFFIHIGDAIRYVIYHFFRSQKVELKKPGFKPYQPTFNWG